MSEHIGHILRMERIFEAPRQVVFDYFTIPELLKTWWGPGGTTTEFVEIDLQEGGICRWDMRDIEGKAIVLTGTISELIIPKRIVMTHLWQGSDTETVVTLEFIDLGEKTRLRLTHEGLITANLIPIYQDGWTSTLERLDRRIQEA